MNDFLEWMGKLKKKALPAPVTTNKCVFYPYLHTLVAVAEQSVALKKIIIE